MILFLPNRHFYRKIQCLFPSKTKSKKSIPVNLLTTQLNFFDFSLNILFKVQNTFKSHRDRFSHFWFTYVFLVTVAPPLETLLLRFCSASASPTFPQKLGIILKGFGQNLKCFTQNPKNYDLNHKGFWSKSQRFWSRYQRFWSKSQNVGH